MDKINVQNAQHCNLRRKATFKRNDVKALQFGVLTFLGKNIKKIVPDKRSFQGIKIKYKTVENRAMSMQVM